MEGLKELKLTLEGSLTEEDAFKRFGLRCLAAALIERNGRIFPHLPARGPKRLKPKFTLVSECSVKGRRPRCIDNSLQRVKQGIMAFLADLKMLMFSGLWSLLQVQANIIAAPICLIKITILPVGVPISYAAVLDGHGGSNCSRSIAKVTSDEKWIVGGQQKREQH